METNKQTFPPAGTSSIWSHFYVPVHVTELH